MSYETEAFAWGRFSAEVSAEVSRRASRATVRNPILALPAASRLATLPPEAKSALRAVLIDIRNDSRLRAEKAWRTHKGPMAVYWKAVGVYANHIARLLK